jgi:hypothetical protein
VKANSFIDDPYGYATNQISHAKLVGLLGYVYGVSMAYHWLMGEFPDKWAIVAFAWASYLAFELVSQGWNGWDTVEDWWFVNVYGVLGAVQTFTESGPYTVSADLMAALPFVVAFCLHLIIGGTVRRLQILKSWGA